MCIRDRTNKRQDRWGGSLENRMRFGCEVVAAVRMGLGSGAVSYTHLRAHETVLDLVCRLLLEKKKTYITRIHYE